MTEVLPEDSISIMANPVPTTAVEIRATILTSNGGDSPTGTDSPGTSQMSPPPSYYDIPGISADAKNIFVT
jgi:hypothetical protein